MPSAAQSRRFTGHLNPVVQAKEVRRVADMKVQRLKTTAGFRPGHIRCGGRMLADRRRRPLRTPRGTQGCHSEAGLSLIEVLVSSMLITVVMVALASFFVAAGSAASRQGGTQVATQLAEDAVEQVRAVEPSAIAALAPTDTMTVNSVPYTRTLAVTPCWQPRTQLNGDCGPGRTPRDAGFLRVVVTVVWTERGCADSRCTYQTWTLVSSATSEPFFESS
jgi:type II secretory pathway pseudopilin PulG